MKVLSIRQPLRKRKKKKSKSSFKWLNRNKKDIFNKLAKENSFRSRSIYKIHEINRKFHFIKKRARYIMDVGSAPGSWLQYINEVTSSSCTIIGIDLKKIKQILGVNFIQGDFTNSKLCKKLQDTIGKNNFDVICSDMSPSTSGNKHLDHIKIIRLAESVFLFSQNYLKLNGSIVIKIFDGNKTKELYEKLKIYFRFVHLYKPEASYKNSSEIFIVALYKI